MASGEVAAPGRQERRRRILRRDGDACVWCGRQVDAGLVAATTEHLVPRVKGGPSWIENEVVACARCNRSRGHTTPAEWLEECRRRGWEPDGAAVLRGLERLEQAIGARGGQRRARPYLRSQLRRMRRLVDA
ncbi:HNH endonuclease [Iamia majanohamensis]|uniref:HNH endonuclease n=1 Tax=Iamia majanohamensis TaxID=467976 RepID=A0AAE9Y5Q2_9ACTN|nr:HNH endonuclease [Iamia majanohamensis]WCO67069.1 HNH endonuclease [Iamia majanohamensis]